MHPDDYLDALLEQLPEDRPGEERRKHALTRSDLKIIALLIDQRITSVNHTCALRLTPDATGVLTDWADMLLNLKKWSLRGIWVIILAVVWGIINIFARHEMWPKGWWQK